jgi:hypothetical protein
MGDLLRRVAALLNNLLPLRLRAVKEERGTVRMCAAISRVPLRRRPDTRLPPLLPRCVTPPQPLLQRRIIQPPRPRRIIQPPRPRLIIQPPRPPQRQPAIHPPQPQPAPLPAIQVNFGGQPRTVVYRTVVLQALPLRLVEKDVLIRGTGIPET